MSRRNANEIKAKQKQRPNATDTRFPFQHHLLNLSHNFRKCWWNFYHFPWAFRTDSFDAPLEYIRQRSFISISHRVCFFFNFNHLMIWNVGLQISLNQIFGKTKRLVFSPTKSEFFKWIFGLSNASHVERCAELIFLADDFNDKSFSRHQTLSLPVQSLVYLASESGVRHNVAARVKCECQTPSSLNAFSRCSMESIQDSVDKIQVFFILSNSLPVQFVWISHHEHWTAHRLSELTRLALDTLIPFEYQFYPVVSIKWICENVHKIR